MLEHRPGMNNVRHFAGLTALDRQNLDCIASAISADASLVPSSDSHGVLAPVYLEAQSSVLNLSNSEILSAIRQFSTGRCSDAYNKGVQAFVLAGYETLLQRKDSILKEA